MIQAIYLYGSEILRKKAEDVDISDKAYVDSLVTDLKDTLAESEGVGLAAPQIGVGRRCVIVDGTGMADVYDGLRDFRRTIINPTVISESAERCTYNEGCLSIPGIYADVERPAEITVEYYDESLRKVTETFTGFACRMVQHELSHLDGTMFVDLVAPIRKKIIGKKLLRIAQGKVGTGYISKIR